MTSSELLTALRSGGRTFGSLIVSTSPRWPASVAQIGLDFVFIDTEHIAIDRAQLSWMCQTYSGAGLAPVVRIPAPDPYMACMALDGGAAGIVAPYVETVEQVRALVGAVKYRPLKGKRLQSALEKPDTLEPQLSQYLKEKNRENLLAINIESRPALDSLDEILAVEGVDVALIGPHDLSCSLGIPEAYDDPRFEEAVLTIIKKARSQHISAGIHSWMPIDRELVWMEAGLNFLIHSGDIIAMKETLTSEITTLRARLGDHRAASAQAENI